MTKIQSVAWLPALDHLPPGDAACSVAYDGRRYRIGYEVLHHGFAHRTFIHSDTTVYAPRKFDCRLFITSMRCAISRFDQSIIVGAYKTQRRLAAAHSPSGLTMSGEKNAQHIAVLAAQTVDFDSVMTDSQVYRDRHKNRVRS